MVEVEGMVGSMVADMDIEGIPSKYRNSLEIF
jgi:hypothetical protein